MYQGLKDLCLNRNWKNLSMNLSPVDLISVTPSLHFSLKISIRQLQLIHNAAARVLTKTKTVDHTTPVLRSLHWLPVCQRIDFKILLLFYKALNGLGPKYTFVLLLCCEPFRPLRSSRASMLHISEQTLIKLHVFNDCFWLYLSVLILCVPFAHCLTLPCC